jgi:hypothetical protein
MDKSPGEMAEWLKAQHWKCCLAVTLTRVRIPLSPFLRIPIKNIQIIDADWLDLEEGDPINLKYFVVS